MKKTALTFGLFSLVAVATSFAPTEAPTYLAANDTIKTLPIDGGVKSDMGRKHDYTNLGGFSSDTQFSTLNRKID
ncbi:hypothetical protein [Flavobacterium anhuiense]|uniref:hypothetical protein n=1 Tax=Flavobacterium anhuiense TaxID=459526 RepID=UPI000E6CA63F|nr:hypothetical protein [Flavobacterium anhuiense]